VDRTKFFVVEKVDGADELDFLHNSLSRFEMKYPPSYYRVTDQDLMRPDMISYYNYGTVAYWWVICLVNGVHSPLTDLEVGQLLVIPHILDVYEFGRKWRVR